MTTRATIAAALMLCVGCGEAPIDPNLGQATEPAPSSSAAVKNDKAKAEESGPLANPTEADFVESDESRDPFRDFSSLFRKPIEEVDKERDRKVKASAFAVDELKLIGIVTRATNRAMLVDPTGFGWILYTGDFVGRAELVNTGGTEGQEVPVNWKVDRIRGGDIVLVREDPARPQIARTTRVIPLFPASDSGRRGT